MITYTAKRSLVEGHVAGTQYDLDVEISQADPSVRDITSIERSAGGAMEVSFERQDVYWTIRTAPVNGQRAQQLIEFLDSIESGETFRVWLSESAAVPLVLKMEGGPGQVNAFMRCGERNLDFFTGEFTALQAAPYDAAGGAGGGGGGGGFAGGDSDPIDIYDPVYGGGGALGPGSAPAGLTFTVTMTYDEEIDWWYGEGLTPPFRYLDNDPEQGIAITTAETVVPEGTVLGVSGATWGGEGTLWTVIIKANEHVGYFDEGAEEEVLPFWDHFRAIRVTLPTTREVVLEEEDMDGYYVTGEGDEAVTLSFDLGEESFSLVPGTYTLVFVNR